MPGFWASRLPSPAACGWAMTVASRWANKETGAVAALPTWINFMRAAIAGKDDEKFPADESGNEILPRSIQLCPIKLHPTNLQRARSPNSRQPCCAQNLAALHGKGSPIRSEAVAAPHRQARVALKPLMRSRTGRTSFSSVAVRRGVPTRSGPSSGSPAEFSTPSGPMALRCFAFPITAS